MSFRIKQNKNIKNNRLINNKINKKITEAVKVNKNPNCLS